MCEPEIFIDTIINNNGTLYNNKYNAVNKNYRLRQRDVDILNNSVFERNKCNNAYNLIMNYMEDNVNYVGEERRERVGRLYNLLIYMLEGNNNKILNKNLNKDLNKDLFDSLNPDSLTYKKDIRLWHVFSYADNKASYMISQLMSENIIYCPLLSILHNYKQVWSIHSTNESRLYTKYQL